MGFKKPMFAAINKRTVKLSPTHLNLTDLMKKYGTGKQKNVPYLGTLVRYVGTLVRYAFKIKLKHSMLVRYGPNYEVRSTQIINVP